MSNTLITCPKCSGNACAEYHHPNNITIWFCYGCGFTSNSTLNTNNPNLDDIISVYPELYKDLKFIDNKGNCWFPSSINIPEKGMVFAEGKSIDDWKWAAVQNKDGKPDMTTKQEYEQYDFMDAMEKINYFSR